MQKPILLTLFVIGLLAVAVVPASAFQLYTLDFEGFANGTALGNQYASQHVTFDYYTVPGGPFVGGHIVTPPVGIPTHSGVNSVDIFSQLMIHFDVDVFMWNAYFTLPGDWFQNGLDVLAYDAAGNLLGDNFIMYGSGLPPNQLLGFDNLTTGIRTIQIDSYNSLPGVYPGHSWMDDMSYATADTPVPEPASLLLLGTGLIGSFAARRKLKK